MQRSKIKNQNCGIAFSDASKKGKIKHQSAKCKIAESHSAMLFKMAREAAPKFLFLIFDFCISLKRFLNHALCILIASTASRTGLDSLVCPVSIDVILYTGADSTENNQ